MNSVLKKMLNAWEKARRRVEECKQKKIILEEKREQRKAEREREFMTATSRMMMMFAAQSVGPSSYPPPTHSIHKFPLGCPSAPNTTAEDTKLSGHGHRPDLHALQKIFPVELSERCSITNPTQRCSHRPMCEHC